MYINKVIIYGNITRDPELKSLPSGMQVNSFSVATNRSYKDNTGAKKDVVEYHNIVAFGKQAEVISQYLKKGNPIFLEGRLQTRSWDGQDGKKQYRTEIVLENFQFGPKVSGMTGSVSPSSNTNSTSKSENEDNSIPEVNYPDEEINPEDIPF